MNQLLELAHTWPGAAEFAAILALIGFIAWLIYA